MDIIMSEGISCLRIFFICLIAAVFGYSGFVIRQGYELRTALEKKKTELLSSGKFLNASKYDELMQKANAKIRNQILIWSGIFIVLWMADSLIYFFLLLIPLVLGFFGYFLVPNAESAFD